MAAALPLCYHGAISRRDCEILLGAKNKDGAYLIRDSETIQGAMCLCVYKKHVVYTYRLLQTHSGNYTLLTAGGSEEVYFKSLDELIRHYKKKKQGLVMHLRHSVKRRTDLLIKTQTGPELAQRNQELNQQQTGPELAQGSQEQNQQQTGPELPQRNQHQRRSEAPPRNPDQQQQRAPEAPPRNPDQQQQRAPEVPQRNPDQQQQRAPEVPQRNPDLKLNRPRSEGPPTNLELYQQWANQSPAAAAEEEEVKDDMDYENVPDYVDVQPI